MASAMWKLCLLGLGLATGRSASGSTVDLKPRGHGLLTSSPPRSRDSEAAGEPKISAVTALLPSGARLRLEATGGCFRWSSQRPDLVAVEPAPEAAACRDACRPLAEGCEAAVELQAVGSVAQVERTLVAARDAAGPELRCEVYVAPIERIEVETSVRRIYVDDVETLAVKARLRARGLDFHGMSVGFAGFGVRKSFRGWPGGVKCLFRCVESGNWSDMLHTSPPGRRWDSVQR